MYLVSERGAILAETDKKNSFWTTLPGILTGFAALLTAVTGSLVALYPHGCSGLQENSAAGRDDAPMTQTTPHPQGSTETASPAPAGKSIAIPATQPKQQATVRVISRAGDVKELFRRSFKYNGLEEIDLTDGQTIPFEKISMIDFSTVMGDKTDVRVTLTDGRTLEGSLWTSNLFDGVTDVGPFSKQVGKLKQIVIER